MAKVSYQSLFKVFVLISLWVCATVGHTQIQNAELAPGFEDGLSPKLNYTSIGRLLLSVTPDAGELRVTGIDKNSPTLQMKSPQDPNEIASLEVGDHIRAVDGQPVGNVQTLQRLLGSGGSEHRLEIVDHRTQQPFEWIVSPKISKQPQMRASVAGGRPRKAYVLIAGLTEDKDIGAGVMVSVDAITRALKGNIGEDLIELTTITGAQCRTDTILETILTLPTGSQDSLVVFFLGHGAFDPRFDIDDSRGHFLQLPGGDLLRRVVWDHMRATPARTRILITDTCNVQSNAKPSQKYALELKSTSRVQVGPTQYEWLFLGHSGSLDIGATSQNQFAWYSSDIGGWFSSSLIEACNSSSQGRWNSLLQDLPNRTQQRFTTKRQEFLAKPGNTPADVLDRLKRQTEMRPVVQNRLTRDEQPPVSPELQRTMTREITVQVPVN